MKTILALTLLAGSIIAAPITYTSQSAYNAATAGLGSVQTENFGGNSLHSLVVDSTSDGYIFGNEWVDFLQNGVIYTSTEFSPITGDFVAFSGTFDLEPYGIGSGVGYILNGPSGSQFAGYTVTDGFLGVISSDPFASITIYTKPSGFNGGIWEHLTLDNIKFSQSNATVTPEPSSFLLIAAGLLLIARRKLA